jgi:hypothetical protein
VAAGLDCASNERNVAITRANEAGADTDEVTDFAAERTTVELVVPDEVRLLNMVATRETVSAITTEEVIVLVIDRSIVVTPED